MIQRKQYKIQIRNALRRSKITAILGPRQCGKTTLAKEISLHIKSHFLDLESPTDRAKLQNPEIYLKDIPGLVIIDEIQLMPELFPILRVLSDQSPDNGRFMILGSASPNLIKSASESLAGRVEFVDLQGFDLTETGGTELNRLWIRGGFPLSYLADTDEDSMAWREGFVRTFLQRDIPQLGIGIPFTTLRRFWTMLAHSHGQVLNSSQLAKSMGMNDKTIRSYIDILSATYMIRPLQPWFSNLKKRQVKSPKVYLTDTGLLHYLLGINNLNTLLGHPQLGSSWESFAMEQIIRNTPGIEPYFWSTYSGAELDLLLFRKGKRIGVEFKFTETPKSTKSMHSAINDLELERLYVIYPGSEQYPLHDLIEATPLPAFIDLSRKYNS
jgi:hypothetical protein